MSDITDTQRNQLLANVSLSVSIEDINNSGYSPFPDIIKLQKSSCDDWGFFGKYFEASIYDDSPELQLSAVQTLQNIEYLNERITKATFQCMAASPVAYNFDNRLFNFHLPLLQRLVVVARRAWDLLVDCKRERGSPRTQGEYEELRSGALYLCSMLGYPALFTNTLGLALPHIPQGPDVERSFNVYEGIITDTGVVKYILNRFPNMLSLWATSDENEIVHFELIDDIPGDLPWGGQFQETPLSDIGAWGGRSEEEISIIGYAKSPNDDIPMNIVLVSTGDCSLWHNQEDVERAWGFSLEQEIERIGMESGQFERESTARAQQHQKNRIYAERELRRCT
jgi:hypothetical protein